LEKLEDHILDIENIDEVEGIAKKGIGIITVLFDSNADYDKSMQEVRNAVEDGKSQLPEDALDSIVKTDLTETAGMLISLSGDNYSYEQLSSFGEKFQEELTKVKGVKKFDIEGKVEKIIEIQLDSKKLNQMGLAITDINNILMMQNIKIPSGSLEKEGKKINVEISGTYEEIDDIKNTVISVSEKTGMPLKLKDLAKISFVLDKDSEKFKQNGNNAIILTGYFNQGENVVLIGQDVRTALNRIRNSLPEDLIIEEIVYQPDDVKNSVGDFMTSLIIGIILVVIVVFFGMGYRNALVVSTAIPFSILITFAVMYVFKIYIHKMSLTALIIALGILVDNGIVISDGIQDEINIGKDSLESCKNTVSKTSVPIFTATLTTVLAFFPLTMIPGSAGKFLQPISIVLIISVVASYLVAMFIIPVLSQWIFIPENGRLKKNSVIRKMFIKMLEWGIANKGKTMIITIFSFLFVMKVIAPCLPSEFFPFIDKNIMYIEINNDTPGNIESTEKLTDEIIEVLSLDKEIKSFTVAIGNGLPKFFISMMPSSPSTDFAQMVLKYDIDSIENRRFQTRQDFVHYLQNKLDSNIVGGKTKVKLLENGPPEDAKVMIRINGEYYGRIIEVLKNLENEIRNMNGVTNIRDDVKAESMQFDILVNSDKASMMGISNFDIQRQINMALYGVKSTVYRKDGKEYDVKLKTDIKEPKDLETFLIKSSITGKKVPIMQYADVSYSTKIDTIKRYNGETTFTIYLDPKPGYSAISIANQIEDDIVNKVDTSGVQLSFDGERENIEKNFSALKVLAIITIGIIYIILMIQFKSFLQPLIILGTIPLSLIGSVIGLFIFRQPMSLTALLGIIALIGLVVKNGILLIEYMNEGLKNGFTVEDACRKAVDKRFNPIILSAATTIMGLFPLAISGNSLFAPMGIALMSGLMISTVLTMVVIPVLFSFKFMTGK